MIPVRIQGIELQGSGIEEAAHIRKSYLFALDRFVHVIREVDVRCADINGPRGGVDKVCRVQLRLYPRGVLTAKSSGDSFMQAAKDACDKVRSLLVKRLSRVKSFNRKPRGEQSIPTMLEDTL